MIKLILWDIDGTLLDFEAAEKAAIKNLFIKFGFGQCTDAMLRVYSGINRKYWQALEKGEMTKAEILVNRFREFFSLYGLDREKAEDFNTAYQSALGDTIVFCDDSKEIVTKLKTKVLQAGASNGTITAQNKKLKNSGFDKLFDSVFLSEAVGYEKPNINFFKPIFEKFPDIAKDEMIIVGDSLTSDIPGGINAGIKTCWYNPTGAKNKSGLVPDYEIKDLHEIFNIINK